MTTGLDALKEYSGNYMTRPVHEEKYEPEPYEPSPHAIEVTDAYLDELKLWDGFARWWEDLGQASRHAVTERLRMVYDKWDNDQ
jgi:hypothetical protein